LAIYQGTNCTASGASATTWDSVETTNKDTRPELF